MIKMTRRFWTWLNADRKRFSVACLLTLFGLLLWSRLILVSNMPRTAIADDEEEVQPDTETPPALAPGSEGSSDKSSGESTHVELGNDPKSKPRTRAQERDGRDGRSDSPSDRVED